MLIADAFAIGVVLVKSLLLVKFGFHRKNTFPSEVEHQFGAELASFKQQYAMKDMPDDYCMYKDSCGV